jgi:hypothetical protein
MCKTKIFKANKIGGAVIYIEHVLSERETSLLNFKLQDEETCGLVVRQKAHDCEVLGSNPH